MNCENRRTFSAAFARRFDVEKLIDFEWIFAAWLSQLFDLSDVRQRVESTAEVGLPSLGFVHVVAILP